MDIKGEDFKYKIRFSGLRKVVRNPKLTSGAKVILIDLLLYANTSDSNCFPSQELLAKNHGKTSRQIRYLLKELQTASLIIWERGQKGKSNRYHFSQEIYFRSDNNTMKSISDTIGNSLPVSIGNLLPTNLVTERSQEGSQSPQLILFEKTFRRKCSTLEGKQLRDMVIGNPQGWVEDAIVEAGKRNYAIVKVGLIGKILEDWKSTGKPPPKPKFISCGKDGCDNGFVFKTSSSVAKCMCRIQYEKSYKIWSQNWNNN